MMDKVSGDQKVRIEYLEKEIKNHNQKHKDFQIILKSEIVAVKGGLDQI